jgi:hypothetical protein
VAADALMLKVREGGRVVNVHALVATGVNADGHREILGLQVTSAEDGAGWLAFFRDPCPNSGDCSPPSSVPRDPTSTTPLTGPGGDDDARPKPAPPTTEPKDRHRHNCRCSTKDH